jgi:hypothetical protein
MSESCTRHAFSNLSLSRTQQTASHFGLAHTKTIEEHLQSFCSLLLSMLQYNSLPFSSCNEMDCCCDDGRDDMDTRKTGRFE